MSKNYNCYHVLDQIFLPWGPTSRTTTSPFVSLRLPSSLVLADRRARHPAALHLRRWLEEQAGGDVVLGLIMVAFSELILDIKFGLELFSKTQISKMVLWLTLNILLSVVWVFALMEIKWKHKKKGNDIAAEDRQGDENI